jgi:hypothetical protein
MTKKNGLKTNSKRIAASPSQDLFNNQLRELYFLNLVIAEIRRVTFLPAFWQALAQKRIPSSPNSGSRQTILTLEWRKQSTNHSSLSSDGKREKAFPFSAFTNSRFCLHFRLHEGKEDSETTESDGRIIICGLFNKTVDFIVVFSMSNQKWLS